LAGSVVRETLALVAVGSVLGLIAALWAMRLMRTLLFGVAPWDPVTYVAAAATLMLAALAASYGPALRAARVDPLRALKHE
jgi:putative ABC transport system permease protein